MCLSYLEFTGRPALTGRDDLHFDPLVIVERLEKGKELKNLKKTHEIEKIIIDGDTTSW